ncbi:STAS-like domain-containing protein, partial [Candidatus Jorgensenbacteria bacterium]|nr:STAS-like domain-containing protein [Candidatus Jorgensenbacteria bacterium]
ITPAIKKGGEVVLDFEKVESVTQSFVHALLSEVIIEFSTEILDKIAFKNCNDTVKGIINIVVDYMQS